jgi:hypothetical protein
MPPGYAFETSLTWINAVTPKRDKTPVPYHIFDRGSSVPVSSSEKKKSIYVRSSGNIEHGR